MIVSRRTLFRERTILYGVLKLTENLAPHLIDADSTNSGAQERVMNLAINERFTKYYY